MEEQIFFFVKSHSELESLSINDKMESMVVKKNTINPWDQAHKLRRDHKYIGYIEPDMRNQNPAIRDAHISEGAINENFTVSPPYNEYDDAWPFPVTDGKPDRKIWHLAEDFSQLKKAWTSVHGKNNIVRVAHFDTGYDPAHNTFPKDNIEYGLQKNFVEHNDSAIDIHSTGLLNQPGHGVGTLSILAGNHVQLKDYSFDDYLGIHHSIKIVPVRISRSVILWRNKAFVDALEYIISLYDDPKTRCHIVTMSMGGLPMKAWADVVNKAYEKGIFIVAATGDNIGRVTPTSVVYPARFNRVVAASGVGYDFSPYYKPFDPKWIKVMQGNFGPRKAMKRAIAAFTPNVHWAQINTKDKVSIQGAGTSAATPQIAAAAALYYQQYFDELEVMSEGWMKVETIRQALFTSALKRIDKDDTFDILLYFGNGVLRAADMLQVKPSDVKIIREQPDKVSWPFLQLLSETGVLEVMPISVDIDTREMLETEILQLIQQSKELQDLLDNEEKDPNELSVVEQKTFFRIIQRMPITSETLKTYISHYVN